MDAVSRSQNTDSPTVTVAAVVAAALGLASAALSAYWAAGGTALLNTIGGAIAEWGRHGGPGVRFALWLIVLLKVGVGVAAPAIADLPRIWPAWTRTRVPRLLSWIAASILIAYGAVLTGSELIAFTGMLGTPPSVDRLALAWHAFVWDPWFLLWGVAFLVCLVRTRPSAVASTRP